MTKRWERTGAVMRGRNRSQDKERQQRLRSGAAATELALVLPLLIFLALGCVDFGRYAYYSIAVQNAARAAAEYAVMNPYPTDGAIAWSNKVTQAAVDEIANQTGYSPGELSVMTSVSFDESSGLPIITVTTSYTGFSTVINWPGIPSNPALSARLMVRGIR
jgi:Flp pilus assembly protein TadG